MGPTPGASPPHSVGAKRMQTGLRDLDARSGRLQGAGLGVDPEDDDRVAVLIGRQEEPAGGVDVEVPGGPAAGRAVAGGREGPGPLVDREDRDAVVPPVRAVEEAAGGVDVDVGGGVLAVESFGEGRDRRRRRQGAGLGVEVERGDGGGHLVDHVGVPAVGVEGEVPGAGAGLDRGRGWVVGGQGAGLVVEPVDEDAVEAEVGGHREAAAGVEIDRVGVRTVLAAGVGAAPPVLLDVAGGLQRAARADRQDRDGAAAVVGDQGVSPLAVDDDVAGARASGRLEVDRRQRPAGRVDGEGSHGASRSALDLGDLADGVEVCTAGMERQKGRILGGPGERRPRERAGLGVHLEQVDPLAAAPGVGADVDAQAAVPSGRAEGGRAQRRREHPQ